jgi:hypothetical protein
MKLRDLAAFVANLATYALAACAVAFLVLAVLHAARPIGAIEHHLAAKIARAGFGHNLGMKPTHAGGFGGRGRFGSALALPVGIRDP